MTPSSRRFTARRLLIFFLFSTLVAAAGRLVRDYTRPVLLSGPMVQIPAPGTISISWRMKSLSGGAVVLRLPVDSSLRQRADQIGDHYEAGFDNLRQEGEYSYTVVKPLLFADRTVVGPFEIHKPASRGTVFRFLAFGDSGNGSNTQADLAKLMATTKPDLIIHTGDLVYPSGDPHDYVNNFFEPYAELIRRIPFMPSLGNHDVTTDHGKPFLDVFDLPRNGPPGIEPERNYWFDFGDARFVALDSNPPEEGGAITNQQRAEVVAPWLRRVLTECDARWKFVYFHHPFYTGSEHPESGGEHMKTAFVKVFEECGVDVVFCGHNHLYERTAPIRNDQAVPEGKGVVYITTGAGGVSRYPEAHPPPAYMRKYNDTEFSFTQVDLSNERFELKQIGEDGKAVDQYVITKPTAHATTAN